MNGITAIKQFKAILVMFAVGVCLVTAAPAEANYDTIMMDDNAPAESIQYQNFDTFYNAEAEGSVMSELQMEESRGAAQIRPPQALSPKEKSVRKIEESFDVAREKRNQQTLKKGNTKSNKDGLQWEEFDYDAYVNHG